MGSIMGSQNIMGLDYGSNISGIKNPIRICYNKKTIWYMKYIQDYYFKEYLYITAKTHSCNGKIAL